MIIDIEKIFQYRNSLYVTGFVKRGLPHTSDLQASTIQDFRWLKGMDLQIVQFRVLI